jgi:hypothetical protein
MDVISVRAFDLGLVASGEDAWRSLGFDLRGLHGEFSGGTILVERRCDEQGPVCFGDALEGVTYTQAKVDSPARLRDVCRVRLEGRALASLNAAAGGYFQLDGWTEIDGTRAALGRPRVQLELTATMTAHNNRLQAA